MASYTITINDGDPDFMSLTVRKGDLITWASGDSEYKVSGLGGLFVEYAGNFTIPAGGQVGPLRVANTATVGRHPYKINEKDEPEGNPDILVDN